MGQALSLRQTLPGWLAASILYISISSWLAPARLMGRERDVGLEEAENHPCIENTIKWETRSTPVE